MGWSAHEADHPIGRRAPTEPTGPTHRAKPQENLMDAVTHVPAPANEPVLDYAPGSPERAALEVALAELGGAQTELPHTINGERVIGTGRRIAVRQPHAHRKVLGTMRNATVKEGRAAVEAAKAAAPMWRELSFDDRAAILLKADRK